jgi:putative membrane protein
MSLLVTWIVTAIAMLVGDELLDGMQIKGGIGSHLVVAALFGILSTFVGGPLFVFLGLASLGLGFLLAFITRLVVSALMLLLVGALSDRLNIRDFKTALVASLIMSVTATAFEVALR